MTDERFNRLAVWSGIPLPTYETHRLERFIDCGGKEKAFNAALHFPKEHHFLTLGGLPGRGKTHLALGIGWFWLINDLGLVKYWQTEQLLDEARARYEEEKEHPAEHFGKSPLEWAQEVGLLILDDLGAEKSSEWAMSKLDELIDFRYINLKPTVFTTNLPFSQLPGRVSSRLKEGTIALVEGIDWREYKAKLRAKNEQAN